MQRQKNPLQMINYSINGIFQQNCMILYHNKKNLLGSLSVHYFLSLNKDSCLYTSTIQKKLHGLSVKWENFPKW